jgi:hypothetical protein
VKRGDEVTPPASGRARCRRRILTVGVVLVLDSPLPVARCQACSPHDDHLSLRDTLLSEQTRASNHKQAPMMAPIHVEFARVAAGLLSENPGLTTTQLI